MAIQTNNVSVVGGQSGVIAVQFTGSVSAGDTIQYYRITAVSPDGVIYRTTDTSQPLTVGDYVATPAGTDTVTVYFRPTSSFQGFTTFDFAAYEGNTAGADHDTTPATATLNILQNTLPETNSVNVSGLEDTTIAVTLGGSDPDGTVPSFTITSLPANGTLYLNSNGTGVIAVNDSVAASGGSAVVYFKPNANYNGPASFTYASKDNYGGQDASPATVNITVTPVNDAPTLAAIPAGSFNENTTGTVVATLLGADVDGDTVTYQFANGKTEQGDFKIVNNTVTYNGPALDYETASTKSWNMSIKAYDGTTTSTPARELTVSLANVNEAPTLNSIGNGSFDENTTGTVVANLSGSDPEGTPLTYKFTNGTTTDGGFTISGSQVKYTGSALDYEAAATKSWSLSVQASDGVNTSSAQTFTVALNDVNEAPNFPVIAPASFSENKNNVLVATLAATDPEGQTVTYKFANGTTSESGFSIVDNTVVYAGGALDYETAATKSWNLSIKASDGTQTASQSLSVSLTNENEAPTDIAFSSKSVQENTAAGVEVGKLSTIDPDLGDTFTYEILGGTGQTHFTVDGNALKTTAVNIDYETTTSLTLQVKSTDAGGLSTTKTLTIPVTNVNEAPTLGAVPDGSFKENATGVVVATLSGSDPEGQTVSYKFSNDTTTDGDFTIVDNTVVYSGAKLDFETAATKSWNLAVKASDGSLASANRNFTVTLTNENEAPTDIAFSSKSVQENTAAGVEVGKLSTSDPDLGDTFTYEILGGTGQTHFTVDGNALKTTAVNIDYETTTSLTLQVKSTDAGGLSTTKTLTIPVTNVNEAPTLGAVPDGSFKENATGVVVASLSGSDPDGQTVSYKFSNDTTTDGDFTILDNTVVYSGAKLDFETAATKSWNLAVKASDGSLASANRNFTVTLTNENEAPTGINFSNESPSISENSVSGVPVGTLSTVDPDAGDTFTYEIVGGTGQDKFTIAGNEVKTSAVKIDYETTPSLTLQVKSTDKGGLSTTKELTIAVTNVNEAPTLNNVSNGSFNENLNNVVVANLSGTDPEGTALTYQFAAGGTTSGGFTIDGASVKYTGGALDFETSATKSWELAVKAYDGLLFSDSKSFTVALNNINEAPTNLNYTNAAALTAGTNPAAVKLTDLAVVDDSLGTNNLSLSGANAGLFEIAGNALYLKAGATPAAGAYAVNILVDDPSLGEGAELTRPFTLTINAAPTPPTPAPGPGPTQGDLVPPFVPPVDPTPPNQGNPTTPTNPNSGQEEAVDLAAYFLNAVGVATTAIKTTPQFVTIPSGQMITNPLWVKLQAFNTVQAGYTAGTTTLAQAKVAIIAMGGDTTAVALQAYNFFTGTTPSVAGMTYLVNAPDTGAPPVNAQDLTDPYYFTFNPTNRYINFAVNLGKFGDGATAFLTMYGSLSFEAAVRKAYDVIIGNAAAGAANINIDAAVAWVVSQQSYFQYYGINDIGTKAAMVGYLMDAGIQAKVGAYYTATFNYQMDNLDGHSLHNINLIGTYSSPVETI